MITINDPQYGLLKMTDNFVEKFKTFKRVFDSKLSLFENLLNLIENSILIAKEGSDHYYKFKKNNFYYVKDTKSNIFVDIKPHQYGFKTKQDLHELQQQALKKERCTDKMNDMLRHDGGLLFVLDQELITLNFKRDPQPNAIHYLKDNFRFIIGIDNNPKKIRVQARCLNGVTLKKQTYFNSTDKLIEVLNYVKTTIES